MIVPIELIFHDTDYVLVIGLVPRSAIDYAPDSLCVIVTLLIGNDQSKSKELTWDLSC